MVDRFIKQCGSVVENFVRKLRMLLSKQMLLYYMKQKVVEDFIFGILEAVV